VLDQGSKIVIGKREREGQSVIGRAGINPVRSIERGS
jgi:hypothetical protein